MSSDPPAAQRVVTPGHLADEAGFAFLELRAANGLHVKALPNGCVYSIECQDILINQVLASPLANGVHRIYLRVRDGGGGVESE